MSQWRTSPEARKAVLEEAQGNSSMPVLSLHFIEVPDYTTFHAKFAIDNGDIVFQFFLSPELKSWSAPSQKKFWGEVFPACLEATAKAHFNADYPRLKAQHIYEPDMELNSWWFRAYGFGLLLDPHKLSLKFLELLDGALDAAIKSM
jgi:hypothetical protein